LTVALSGTGNPAVTPGSDTLSPATVDFGVVTLGSVATRTVTFTNGSNTPVTVYNYANSNSAFSVIASTCVITIPANSSCVYTLQFAPTAGGLQTGIFQVGDRISNPSVNVTGTATIFIETPQIAVTPNPVVFKDVPRGQAPGLMVTLTNGSSFPITLDPSAPTSDDPNGLIGVSPGAGANSCPVDDTRMTTLAPGTSCSFYVYFYANMAVDTSLSATITFPYTPIGSTFKYAATATVIANEISVANAVVTPTKVQFPATAPGKTSPTQVVTVTNTGEQSLGFVSAILSGTNTGNFTATNKCPLNLSKNASCQVSVAFSPDATTNVFTAVLDVKTSVGDTDVTLTGGTSASDFVLSSPSLPQPTLNPTWQISIAPLTASIGFNQPITFSVSGLDPSYGTPVFTPSTVTPNGSSVSTVLTLTQSPSAAVKREAGFTQAALPVLVCSMALFVSFRRRLKKYGIRCTTALLFLALTTFMLNGCGDQQPPVNFTVTATSGSITHTLSLTLQP
jgi:hypothetical protein